jgi:hypothetical protein
MVNRSLPAVTTSLGILATPVIGVVSSAITWRADRRIADGVDDDDTGRHRGRDHPDRQAPLA